MILVLILSLLSKGVFAQDPVLFEPDIWTLHYIVFDGVQTDVIQPSPQDPQYDPGIHFEDNAGESATIIAFIYFNLFQSLIEFDTTENYFTTIDPMLTLGECEAYCEYEAIYLENFLLRDALGHTYQYEIIDEGGGNKLLILTDEEGNIAVHGNYSLDVEKNEVAFFVLAPTMVDDYLEIYPKEKAVDKISIYSLEGRIIYDQAPENNRIELRDVQQGVYFIELVSGRKKSVQRIVKL